MKKVSVLLLIIVSLIMASFAGIGVPNASAASSVTSATAIPPTVNATNVVLTVTFRTSKDLAANDTVSVSLYGQTISSGSKTVTLGALSPASAVASGNIVVITLGTGQTLPKDATYTLQITGTTGITNPSQAGPVWVNVGTSQETIGSTSIPITGGSVTGLNATVLPNTPSTAAAYTIAFATPSGLAANSTPSGAITIQFPYQTTFIGTPYGTLNNGYVQLSGGLSVAGSYYLANNAGGYVLTITLAGSSSIPAGGSVWISISSSMGVKTPPSIGTYFLSVSTSADTTPASASFQLIGTSISDLTVAADPKAQSAAAQFTLTFTTSSTGALTANRGTIILDFPATMTLPASIGSGTVTVNGSPAYYVSVDSANKIVTVTTPVAVAAYQNVSVVIPKTAGITNPASSGTTVSIGVSTSSDVVAVSGSYTTVTSQVTQPQIQLTSYGAGSVTGYTITFSTGAVGTLRAGYDTIVITFPSGTVLPATISQGLIKINNVAAYNATVSGLRLTIVPAVNVPANAAVQLVIDKTAGIKNPPTATSYTLQVSTSVEVTPVASASYTIVNLPKTIIVVSPASPDGLAGYYKTRPTVVLAASSTIDPAPVIYYAIGGGAQQVYATPFQLPDGNVTLTYYARDRQGNQEDVQTFTAKVDATPPTATIVSPAQGATVGASPVTIVGKVAPGMQVNVAGTPVTVSATGDFSAAVTLREGPQAITIAVTSVSGNIGQTQLAITLDTTPPVLTITKPVMYSTVLTSICEVTGKTEPGAVVKVAGSAVTVNADGTFSSNVMLKEGDNLIEITATDAVGNQRKTAIPVTYKARTVIHLQVGNKTAMVNDTKKTLQVAPVIKSGNTMVPLRFIGEAFGATVTWDPVFQIIDISLKGSSIRLQVGTNYASVAGKKVILQGVPVIISGTTMVPIRFISEAFGAQVDWTAATQGIDITYPKP